MKKLFLYIVCAMLPLFGADEPSFRFTDTVNDNQTSGGETAFTCASQPENDNYETEIIGYDFENGIVKCKVRDKRVDTYDTYRSFNADKQYVNESFSYLRQQKLDEITREIAFKNTVKDTIKNMETNIRSAAKALTSDALSDIEGEISVDSDKINLSHYLAGLATLQYINPKETAGTEVKYDFNLDIPELETTQEFRIAQAMNQANIEYFRELYYGMNSIYIHLQNLLFIVVGGFFLATLGGQKIQKYLENRGQSTGQKEPYLHKFFIPLLCAGVFYMPITDSGGVNSTIIQNIIRYFTNEATTIADKASIVGLTQYTRKFDKEHNLRNQIEKPKQPNIDKNRLLYLYITEVYLKRIKTEIKKCETEYKDEQMRFFEDIDEKWLVKEAKKELFDTSLVDAIVKGWSWITTRFSNKEIKNPSISLEACKYLASEYTRYFTAQKLLEKQYGFSGDIITEIVNKAKDVKEVVSDTTGNKERLEKTSATVFTILKHNEKEYGWLNSLIAPASVMLLSLQRDAKKNAQFNSKADITQMLDDKKIAVMEALGEEADEADFIPKMFNYALDKVVVFMLPGSKSIYEMITKTDSQLFRYALSGYISYNLYSRGGSLAEIGIHTLLTSPTFVQKGLQAGQALGEVTPIIGPIIKGLSKLLENIAIPSVVQELSSMYLGIATVYFLYMDILEKLPLIIVSIAGILAFITYFVSLCKYYYISPFIVAFALTTKRVDKIINFLMIGITIFFKPVLIVLFIYLALFLHGIVYELFIITSVSQFNSIMASSPENSINIGTQFTIGIIKTLLQFFGSLGSCYIVWKTIMTGPDWVFKMLGLETSATSEATQQLAGKLEQKAVVI